MVIADFNVVRRKAGNRSPDIIPDADLQEAVEGSDAFVCGALGKFDWTTSDPGYYAVKEVSELFAAADILSRTQTDTDKTEQEFERAKYKLEQLKSSFSAISGNEELQSIITIVSPEHKTYPLNPSAIYRRPFGKGEAIDDLVGLRSGND